MARAAQVNCQGAEAREIIPAGRLFARVEYLKGEVIGGVYANPLGKIGLAGSDKVRRQLSLVSRRLTADRKTLWTMASRSVGGPT